MQDPQVVSLARRVWLVYTQARERETQSERQVKSFPSYFESGQSILYFDTDCIVFWCGHRSECVFGAIPLKPRPPDLCLLQASQLYRVKPAKYPVRKRRKALLTTVHASVVLFVSA